MCQSPIALIGIEHEENLSLRYLAASLERVGFPADLLALNEPGDEARAIAHVVEHAPRLVGVSVPFQHRAELLLKFTGKLRSAGFAGHLVCGGHFATFEYARILEAFPGVDSVARHEGEETIVELARALHEGEPIDTIPGLVTRAVCGLQAGPPRRLPALDGLPFPDRRGEPQAVFGFPIAPILGSRGCYADCSFCCIQSYFAAAEGPRFRQRSVESIVAEMKMERLHRGIRIFVFHDDTFLLPGRTASLDRYGRMWELMRREGLTDIGLVIKCRPDDVDREVFGLLQDMGLVRAYVGIETNSGEGLVSLNRRVGADDNLRAMQVLNELGVFSTYNLLLFDPEATFRGIGANLAFAEAHTEVPFNFCRAEAYPGTPMKARLEAEGRLWGDFLGWDYEMRDPRIGLLVRLADTVFQGRNFRSDGIATLNMGLRFDAEVLRRFLPRGWDEELNARMKDFSRRFALDSIEKLRKAAAFCEAVDLSDVAYIRAFTAGLARSTARADLDFLGEARQLQRECSRRTGLDDYQVISSTGQPTFKYEVHP